jgi:hypothetical protein
MGLKPYRRLIILIGIAAFIKIFSLFPFAVEKYYSTGIYPAIARVLRILFGWIPFSIGDIFYIVMGVYFLYHLISVCKKLFRKQVNSAFFIHVVRVFIQWVIAIYIVFNITWGLNYNRKGIDFQMQLPVHPYDDKTLQSVLQLIVIRLNELDSASRNARHELNKNTFLFDNAVQSYQEVSDSNNFLVYHSPSVKPSIFSYFGNYLGFSGYYNPFSGEAQVNTTVPVYVRPFTTCHEIGHQLGYAKENEANFAGYLSARSSDNPAFRYSVYLDLYLYAASELYVRDSTLLVPLREQLKPSVRKDFRDLKEFFRKYENPFEPYIRKMYGRYLKANDQPKGIMTYDEVTGRIVAYYNKYKTI